MNRIRHQFNSRRSATAEGSAVVVSLIFIVLVSIALTGFLTTARSERKTAASHYAKLQANLLNKMAVDEVAARINSATTVKNTWWVSQPGRITYTSFSPNAAVPTSTSVPLSSGTADTLVKDVSVELNPAALTDPNGLIVSGTTTSLPIKWKYVYQDGSQTSGTDTTAPTYSGTNPVIGRYAYWTDDQSSRVNLNTAASRTAPQDEGIAHPSRVNLATISPFTADDDTKLRALRQNRLFSSVEEAKAAAPDSTTLADAIASQKHILTHYSQSPNLNRFGEPRIVLTTQKSLAGDQPFFDILKSDNANPGDINNVDDNKVNALFAKLYPYFTKRACDWGLTGIAFNKTLGGTAGGKYTNLATAQTIINLIDYVRSAETADVQVFPIRGSFQPSSTAFASGVGSAGGYAMRGNSRRLHIVEMGCWVPPDPIVKEATVKIRFYWPNGDVPRISLSGLRVQYNVWYGTSEFYPYEAAHQIVNGEIFEPDKTIGPGEYRTVSIKYVKSGTTTTARSTLSTTAYIRTAIKNDIAPPLTATPYDIAPVDFTSWTGYAPYVLDNVAENDIQSISVNDPASNQSPYDWQTRAANTFNTQNPPAACKLGKPVAVAPPQQDADASGNLTDVGIRFPGPKGSSSNPKGMVGSVGEIGFVHTGGQGTSVAGTAYRSIRLQPRCFPNGSLPDWVLLDLFTAPRAATNDADKAVLCSTTNTLGGQINLNAMADPFTTAQFSRTGTLKTVLRSINPPLTDTNAETLAGNILNQTLATGSLTTGTTYGSPAFVANKLYPMPGEVCEVKGIADTGEDSESMTRALTGFLTTQSNVFSVYSIGQKITQLPGGRIQVNSESREQTLLERQENGKVRMLSRKEIGL